MSQQEPPPQRRSRSGGSPDRDSSSSGRRGAHWEVRRTGKPWQGFIEKFGFTLIAIGVAMLVGILIARMG